MVIKFFQLNILKGKFLDRIIDFVKDNDFDILHFQEVTGSNITYGNEDCFEKIKKALDYGGEIALTMNLTGDKKSYFANATFFKKNFSVQKKEIIWLKKYKEIVDYNSRRVQDDPRCALVLEFKIKNRPVKFINTHLAWGPTPADKKFKLIQGKRLACYVNSLNQPFVLSGDFNVVPSSKIVSWLSKRALNLTVKNKIDNTLNLRVHSIKNIIPSGLAVDYIFMEKSLKVNRFRLVDKPDLSDHFGLAAEFAV